MITFTITSCWGCFTVKTEFLHGLQTGFWVLIYMYEYINYWEDDLVVYPLRPLFSRIKWICHDFLTFYSSFITVGSDTYIAFILSSFYRCLVNLVCTHCFTTSGLHFNVFPLWYRGKRCQSTKNIQFHLVFKEKQYRRENSFYR